jgi:tRNA pseudouridine38-40 synthase
MEPDDKMHNIALLTEYDGTPFCGWQSQKNSRSIQDEMQKVILKLTGEKVSLHGCSRTDAGVHATGHVSNFFSETKIPIEKIPIAMNSLLPPEIAVKKAAYVDGSFHARFCATGKQYRYSIWNDSTRPALNRNFYYYTPRSLCVGHMREAAEKMTGTRDFAAFMASGSDARTTVRTLSEIVIIDETPKIHMVFSGNGFLYNMVRIMAGTLLYVGLGKIGAEEIEGIISGKERDKAGKTLPACGLVLEKVFYDHDIFHDIFI